jgi:hypothetical protein
MDRRLALDQTLIKRNITSKFKDIGTWPFNLKTIDEKNKPNEIHMVELVNNHASNKSKRIQRMQTNIKHDEKMKLLPHNF